MMSFVTKENSKVFSPEVLQSKAMMQEISETCNAIQQQVGQVIL